MQMIEQIALFYKNIERYGQKEIEIEIEIEKKTKEERQREREKEKEKKDNETVKEWERE